MASSLLRPACSTAGEHASSRKPSITLSSSAVVPSSGCHTLLAWCLSLATLERLSAASERERERRGWRCEGWH